MAVTSITNLVPSFPDQFPGNAQNPQPATGTSPKGIGSNPTVVEDTFTPSKQNNFALATAQDAGIFQLNQGAQTAVPAGNELAQTGLSAIQTGEPTQTASTTTVNASSTQGTSAQPGTATIAAAKAGADPAAQTAANPAAAQNQIQALNAALPSLGLNNEEIQQIDRIASLVGNFNPAAYASIVSQFESLAQQAAQQGAPNTGATAIPGTGAPSNPSVSANGVTYQLQGALIHFSVQNAVENSGAGNGNGQGQSNTSNNGQGNAAGLQVSQVQFALSTGNGQTVQVQAPQQSTNAGTPDLQGPQIVALAG
jgi:hypothetical protein